MLKQILLEQSVKRVASVVDEHAFAFHASFNPLTLIFVSFFVSFISRPPEGAGPMKLIIFESSFEFTTIRVDAVTLSVLGIIGPLTSKFA